MERYKEEEVRGQTLRYFDEDELATDVWINKYALKDKEGNLLEKTPDDMHRRIAKELARIEKKYPNPLSEERIYKLLKDFKYIVPQGSPMAAIGNYSQHISLSNCFVVDAPHDSYGGIMHADQELAHIYRRRGGCGIDISTIRPKGLPTANAAGTTDGIGVFMERYSNTTREVAQSGRRGALMLTISIHHPEIETFINIKKNLQKVTGANISIRLTDEFMEAVRGGEEFQLRWPVEEKEKPTVKRMVNAKEIWDQIIDSAWESAEPGLIFWDRILEGPADAYEEYRSKSTNPCSELPLSPYDSCRLLLLNLYSYVKAPFTCNAEFDYDLFADHAVIAQRLMDDIVDLEIEHVDRILEKIDEDPEPDHIKKIERDLWLKIRKACINGRRTGTGVTGLGDCLAALGIRYGSEKSIETTENIYRELSLSCFSSSINMAAERGAFPAFDKEISDSNEFNQKNLRELPAGSNYQYKEYGIRNISMTTTAPAGSVSILTQTTSGIEPAFLLSYKRRRKVANEDERVDFVDDLGDRWQEYTVYHPKYKIWLDMKEHPETVSNPYEDATANDIDWEKSVDIQAAAQKWVSHAISKTCNLPSSASKGLVSKVYMQAWEKGCKGFTVYRDGSRSGVLVSNEEEEDGNSFLQHDAPKRPEELECEVFHTSVKGERYTVFVGLYEGKPYEVMGGLSEFIEIPTDIEKGRMMKLPRKSRANRYDFHFNGDGVIKDVGHVFNNSAYESVTRLISLSLRHGAKVSFIVEQLMKDPDNDFRSFYRIVSRVLKKYIEDGTEAASTSVEGCETPDMCQLVYQEGCITCKQCGLAKCG